MANKKTEVFISYRRTEGWELARLVYQSLAQNNYNVFFDIEKLFKGKFGGSIKNKLEESKIFILILTRNTLLRCVTEAEKDWVKQEIETAFNDKNKVIISLKDDEFVMPKGISEPFLSLVKNDPKHNRYCIDISKENYQDVIDQVCNIMVKHFDESITREEKLDDTRFTSSSVKHTSKKSQLTDDVFKSNVNYLVNSLFIKKGAIDNTIEGQTVTFINDKILSKLKNSSNLNILEVGTFDLMLGWKFLASNARNISNYSFTSCCFEACQILNGAYQTIRASNAKALVMHPEKKTYINDLNNLVKSIGDKFDAIIVNNALTYYKDSDLIVKQLKTVLKDDGAIILLNNDDALNFSYPDENLAIKQFNMLKQDWNKDYYGNIHTGREIYGYLINNDFVDITLTTKCYSGFFHDNSSDEKFAIQSYEWNDTFFEKKLRFYNEFNELKRYYENCKRGEREAGAKLKLLNDLEDTLLKTYCSTKTFNVNTLLICYGFNTKNRP